MLSRTTWVNDECKAILDDMIFTETFDIIFQVHRASRKGYLSELFPEDKTSQKICTDLGRDVFGHCQNKVQKFSEDIDCPNCHRQISTTRFAPHLEKCFGKGRTSSRIASQKISSAEFSFPSHGQTECPEDDDWQEKKKRKRKKDSGSKKAKKKHIESEKKAEPGREHAFYLDDKSSKRKNLKKKR